MNRAEEIRELKDIIKRLSIEMSAHREQLQHLQSRLDELEKEDTHAVQQVAEPAQPDQMVSSPDEKLSIENFIGLRLMHLVGIVVLVIGISIGVKYAVDKELISETARIVMAYMAGVILYLLSDRLKRKFALFSAILFSGAMASLYFTTYAAFVYYQLFPFGIAFLVMVLITVFTAYTAIRYNRQEIAILGMIGAYGIPFLISANSDKIQLFFAYILLINAGIAFLSFKKTWKAMILLAMLVSWTLYLGWAFLRYDPSQEMQAALFIGAFYLLFVIASLGFPLLKRQRLQLMDIRHFIINNVLAFAAALVIFTNNSFDSRSTIVTGLAFLFFLVQALLVKISLPAEKLLFKWPAGMSLLCLVFYVGMKWDGITVTITWLGIATVLFITGVIGRMAWLRLMAILLTGVTLVKLVIIDRESFTTIQKIIAYIGIGVLLLVLSFFYQRLKGKQVGESRKSERQ